MFYKYEIKNVNGVPELYLYLTLKYEFSNELNFTEDNKLRIMTYDFIKNNNINFYGNTINLVVDGVIVKRFNVNNQDYICSEKYSPDNFLVNIKLEDNSLCEISLREYLLSVILSKYSNELGDEVLKCLCILYNTFCFKMMREDNYINSNNPFALFIPLSEYKDKYKNYEAVIKRLNNIIDECRGIFISYNNEYILPFIHYCNSGKTISNIKYAYLSSVKSLWDLSSPSYLSISDYNYEDVNEKLGIDINGNVKIRVSNNGRMVHIGGKSFSIFELKNTFNLDSNDISIIVNKDNIRFITKGLGNGLGLSIYGSCCIEYNGGNYYNILNYYFPKCKLNKYIKELSK